MSSAVVIVPSVLPILFPSVSTSAMTGIAAAGSSGTGSTGAIIIGGSALGTAGLAAAAILTPIAIGILLDSMTDSICMSEKAGEKPCKENLETAAKHAGDQIEAGLKNLKASFSREKLSAKSHKMLMKAMEVLEKSAKELTAKISRGTLTHAELEKFKDSVEIFSEKSGREKARLSEMKLLYDFYSEKFEKEIAVQTEKYGAAETAVFRKAFSGIGEIGEDSIEEKLDRMTGLFQDLRKFGEAKAAADEVSRLNEIRAEAEFYFQRIRSEAPDADVTGLEKILKKTRETRFAEAVSTIRDEIKLKYQKIHEESVLSENLREKLNELLKVIPQELPLHRRISKTVKSKSVPRALYRDLAQEAQEHFVREFETRRRALIEEKIKSGITKLDYVVADASMEESLAETLSSGGIALLDTKYPEYKLLVKLAPDNSLIIRFVKVVQDEEEKRNVSETQIRHDRALMKEWCGCMDIFLEGLRQNGLLMAEKLRVEDQVDYLTIEQLDLQKINTAKIKKDRKKKTGSPEKRLSKKPDSPV